MPRKEGYSEEDYNNLGQQAAAFLEQRDIARNEVNSLLESKNATSAELAASKEKLIKARARAKRLKQRVKKLKGRK
jgi:ABC-type transporter Mla subunit MlaD